MVNALPLYGGVWPLGFVAILSLEVTAQLVALGFGLGFATDGAPRYTSARDPGTGQPFPPIPIVDCTGPGVPVVVTTAYPHTVSNRLGACGGMSCIVSGVRGNDAANNIDTYPTSLTIGTPSGVLAVPTGPTTLALYAQDMTPGSDTEGGLMPIIGSGLYAGGGSLTPALTDGSVLIGREMTRENSAPPRIVMAPKAVTRLGSRQVSVAAGSRTSDLAQQRAHRTLLTEQDVFDVHCWGQWQDPDPVLDMAVTRALAHAVMNASVHLHLGTTQSFPAGVWDDEKERTTQHVKSGHLFSFGFSCPTPVLDAPWPFTPDTTVFAPMTQMGSEPGCGG